MAHIHTESGQLDYTVAGYLVHNDKTLLIKHKYLPIWTAPAGHVEVNETPIEALFKEIREESGIDASHLTLLETHVETKTLDRDEATYIPLPFDLEVHNITDEHRHINSSYVLTSDTDDVRPGDGESQTFRWFSIDDLQKFTETPVRIIQAATYAINYVKEHQS